jgi:shikimate dehydrogenase
VGDRHNDKSVSSGANNSSEEAVHDPGAGVIDLLTAHLNGQSANGPSFDWDFQIGLIGRGIQESRSPIMHEQEGHRLGLKYSYSLLDFDQLGLSDSLLPDVIEAARQIGFAGLNVTHPFKQAVVRCVTSLSPEAQSIGAANTVVLAENALVGHNTDSWGFSESFRAEMDDVSLESVTLFGAGGAGAAITHALIDLGALDITLVDKDLPRAEGLATRMAEQFGSRVRAESDFEHALAANRGVINATPVGMAKYPGTPFPIDLLSVNHWVSDVVYFPQETELLRGARELGCRTLAGTGMAVYQAIRAFELFTGIKPDRTAMIQHFGAAA